jgi:hypothetical protein
MEGFSESGYSTSASIRGNTYPNQVLKKDGSSPVGLVMFFPTFTELKTGHFYLLILSGAEAALWCAPSLSSVEWSQ